MCHGEVVQRTGRIYGHPPQRPNAQQSLYGKDKEQHPSGAVRDSFQWKIIKAVPEDGPDGTGESSQWHGLREYTVAIEEHIVQEFPVSAYDIFHALQSAEEQYERGSLVVKSSRPNARLMMARDTVTGETTEWKEF